MVLSSLDFTPIFEESKTDGQLLEELTTGKSCLVSLNGRTKEYLRYFDPA